MLSVEPDILTDLPWGQLLVNGLALGSLYALTAFGIVLIFKTTKVITFAQGETAMFSTFVAFTLLTAFQLPFAVAFVLTMLFAGVFGALIERVVIRRISTTTVLNPVIMTVGLSLILLGAAGWIWGYEIRTFPDPVVGTPFHLGTVVVSQLNALIFLVTLVLMTVLFAFFRFSPTGIAMRAVAENRAAAQLMGISIGRMNALGWGMGTAMGAVTGWAGTRPRRSRRSDDALAANSRALHRALRSGSGRRPRHPRIAQRHSRRRPGLRPLSRLARVHLRRRRYRPGNPDRTHRPDLTRTRRFLRDWRLRLRPAHPPPGSPIRLGGAHRGSCFRGDRVPVGSAGSAPDRSLSRGHDAWLRPPGPAARRVAGVLDRRLIGTARSTARVAPAGRVHDRVPHRSGLLLPGRGRAHRVDDLREERRHESHRPRVRGHTRQ